MSSDLILETEGLTKEFAGFTAVGGVELRVKRGTIQALIGPNGAGKSTLFRMITGQEAPDEGQVVVDRGITIGYFSQDVGDMSGRIAVAEVMDGVGPVSEVAA